MKSVVYRIFSPSSSSCSCSSCSIISDTWLIICYASETRSEIRGSRRRHQDRVVELPPTFHYPFQPLAHIFFLSFFLSVSVSVSGCVFPMERQRRSDYPVSIAGELTAKNWRWIHQDPLSLPARFPVGGVALVRSTDSPVESFIFFFVSFSCLFLVYLIHFCFSIQF